MTDMSAHHWPDVHVTCAGTGMPRRVSVQGREGVAATVVVVTVTRSKGRDSGEGPSPASGATAGVPSRRPDAVDDCLCLGLGRLGHPPAPRPSPASASYSAAQQLFGTCPSICPVEGPGRTRGTAPRRPPVRDHRPPSQMSGSRHSADGLGCCVVDAQGGRWDPVRTARRQGARTQSTQRAADRRVVAFQNPTVSAVREPWLWSTRCCRCPRPGHCLILSSPTRSRLAAGRAAPHRVRRLAASRTQALGPAGQAAGSCGGRAAPMTDFCTCCTPPMSLLPRPATMPRPCADASFPRRVSPSSTARRGRCAWPALPAFRLTAPYVTFS